MEEKQKRMKELVELLNKAAYTYEQKDDEIMSNFEYDKLYDELVQLEKETNMILSKSPTQRAGYEVLSELPKEQHETKMLSLDKTKEIEDLKEWLKDKEGLLSWKMDGLTIVLTYKDGALLKAVTRGNGEIGEVVTNNAKVFKNIPIHIPYQGEMVLRGEAIIKYSDFEKINAEIEEGEAKYKNPRNLCSGAVRQLNNEITAKRNVNFIAFALIKTGDDISFATHKEQIEWMKEQGFETVEERTVTADTIEEEISYFAEQVEKNDIPSDGLVLIYNDIAYGKSLGVTSKFPRDSIAFKWRDEIKETKLLEIEWSASRTGLINPVAIFEPIELEGTSVSRASLHNISIMEGLELGIGDTITVYKANMIIPQVAENLTKSKTCKVPENCPVCGKSALVKDENGVKVLFCVNEECLAKKIKLFSHFVARDAMNIEGLSEATIEKLIAQGFIKELADLFHVEKYKEEIIKMEGFGERSYANLVDSIERSKTTSAAKFIFSLGIPNIGLSNAKLICKEFKNDMNAVMNASIEDLTEINGVGGVIAEAFAAFFAKEENKIMVQDLLKEITFKEEEIAVQKLDGKTFVITGTVEHFENRTAMKEAIERLGGKVSGSVSTKTTYLINNDNKSNSSKNKKAKELSIPIITEEELIQMINEKESENEKI